MGAGLSWAPLPEQRLNSCLERTLSLPPPPPPWFLQTNELHDEFNIDLRVLGIASSSRMLLSETGVDLATWRADWEAHSVPADLKVRLGGG